MDTLTSPPAIRRPARDSRHRISGVTLVETLVVLAITAILTSVGVPSMSGLVDSVRLTSATNSFISGLYLARSEAIKRRARVVLCKSADGIVCSATGGWHQGWIVFHDANNDGNRGGAETVIARETALAASLRLVGNLNVARYVSFGPNGTTRLVSGGFQAGTLTLCRASASSGKGREIILNAIGRARVQKVDLSDCA